MKTQTVEKRVVGLGGNEFETGSITVAANATIKEGALLKRDASGKFTLVTDLAADTPVAINPFDISNTGSAPADMSLRAIVFGSVRADMLHVNGLAVTSPALFDKIRANTNCTPIHVNDISRTS
jgi:hypothetical protein